MTDTTQEDVRLAKCCCDHDWFGPHQQGCPAYDPNEWADWYKAQLTAYQSLGSPEYLAALVEENRAERVEVERLRKESDRLHEVALYYQGQYMREVARGRHPAEYPNDDKGPGMPSPAHSGCDANAAHDNAERLREEGL